jgi:hypothetical protein
MVPYSRTAFGVALTLCLLSPLFCFAGQETPDFSRPHAPHFLSFEVPDSAGTYPVSINDLMVITGYYKTQHGETRGFVRYDDGSITTFAVSGALSTVPVGINHGGDIAGYYLAPLETDPSIPYINEVPQGFVRTADGTVTTFGNTLSLENSSHFWALPVGINVAGEIVGNNFEANLSYTVFTRSAAGSFSGFFLGPSGVSSTVATGINSSGAILGFLSLEKQARQGFLWSGTGTPPSAASNTTTPIIAGESTWTTPTAVNDEGDIVGCYLKFNNYLAFLRDQEGVITTLDLPGESQCDLSINDGGLIVGSYVSAAKLITGFMKPLHGDVHAFLYPGATMTTPASVNNLDVITGYYSNGSSIKGFILTPAP